MFRKYTKQYLVNDLSNTLLSIFQGGMLPMFVFTHLVLCMLCIDKYNDVQRADNMSSSLSPHLPVSAFDSHPVYTFAEPVYDL